jgi:hypothetical protein
MTEADRMCSTPIDPELLRDKGRGYCGRRSGRLTSDRRLVNCSDCQAAIRADNQTRRNAR